MSSESSTVTAILESLQSLGYECMQDVSLGPARASACASRKVRWWGVLPYHIHYYIFDTSHADGIDLNCVLGLNALARAHTDRFKHKRSRWLRFRIPITATVVLSPIGFADDVVAEITRRKQRYQMGDVNSILLVDSGNRRLHSIQRTGFLACLPLGRIGRYTGDLLKAASVL